MRAALMLGIGLALGVLLFVANPVAQAKAERCYADWTDAAPIVKREALTSAKEVRRQAAARDLGALVKITLCDTGGGFIYRLVFFETSGGVRNLTVDARRPFR